MAASLGQVLARLLVIGFYSVFSLFLAIIGYILVYNLYIPSLTHERPVYFSFGPISSIVPLNTVYHNPTAMVHFADGKDSFLRKGQRYDVSVLLTSADAYEYTSVLGNFMLDLRLLSPSNKTLYHASRPVLLRHRSGLVRSASALLRLPFLLTGHASESIDTVVFLLEGIVDGQPPAERICSASLTLSTGEIRLESAAIRIVADFGGLRYAMYYWWTTSAILGTALLWSWLMAVGATGWLLLRNRGKTGTRADSTRLQRHGSSGNHLKRVRIGPRRSTSMLSFTRRTTRRSSDPRPFGAASFSSGDEMSFTPGPGPSSVSPSASSESEVSASESSRRRMNLSTITT